MDKTKKTRQTFLEGSFVLLIAISIAKVLGAIFRIPLTNLLSSRGMGYYATAYDLFLPIYTVAMAGLPVAVSRLVAERAAKGRYKDVKKILKVSLITLLITGTVCFFVMLLLAVLFTGNTAFTVFGKRISLHIFSKGVLPGILAIAPSIIFCAVLSAYRGFFEGLGDMRPTGISQVIEALGKLGFGLIFAYLILSKTGSYSLAAAGALLGVTLGCATGTVYLIIKHKRFSKGNAFPYSEDETEDTKKQILKALAIIAIPIVLGSFVTNVTSLIDVMMVQKRLTSAIQKSPEFFESTYKAFITAERGMAARSGAGYSVLKDLPNSLYGCHRGFAFSIFNLVPMITTSLGISAIPVLATAFTMRDNENVKSNIQTMIKTAAIIALPCGMGIIAVPSGILNLLFDDTVSIAVAEYNLRILGIAAIFAGISVPLVNMLQAIGKERIPLINIAIGAAIKIILNYVLIGTPYINIKGVPIGTCAFYAFVCISNLLCLIKYCGVKIDFVSVIIKPFGAAALCGAAAYFSSVLLAKTHTGLKVQALISIAAGVVVYLLFIALFKVLSREDVLTLPAGEKVYSALKRLKIVK